MARHTNESIVPAALRGEYAETANGNFSTHPAVYGAYAGNMPKAWARLYAERVSARKVSQVIFSYRTPIAWLDADYGWIIPTVTYSVTTSGKHQPHLHRGWNRPGLPDPSRLSMPWDATPEDARRVLSRELVFVYNAKGDAVGTRPGPNYTPEAV